MTFERSPEQIQAIFRRRAIRLAQKQAGDTPAAAAVPALIFRLAAERYAIALRDLAEVLPLEACTPVPGSRPEFRGVINLRGEIRPVVDLARLVSGTSSTESGSVPGSVLILRDGIGLKVDAVEELRELRTDEMTRPAEGRYVKAVLPGAVALLDVEAILPAVSAAKESRFV